MYLVYIGIWNVPQSLYFNLGTKSIGNMDKNRFKYALSLNCFTRENVKRPKTKRQNEKKLNIVGQKAEKSKRPNYS